MLNVYHQDLIIDYINELEEQLYEWDGSLVNWQMELGTIHNIIKILTQQSFESTDPLRKTIIAKLEYRIRRIRYCILRRSRMTN